ncbi:Putative DnaJ domain, Chaperone J-domain superfamily [Septoria linicola]|uniref:DnaJ domain, Chaperone J-domain superfamily n=1 Tax=Septoria linicola TaxID=215465 RepID=A0A9Q9B2D0_9PEZI|nr:putative DnaJ domain, Chaperone J-domain superfamily [Septoria linicola]USW57653.1 Putative DnaJ domain, Chaperone J-domain superfamily [Septoria linicola]
MIRLHLLLLAAFVAVVAAWSKEDHEIFRLNDEVQKSEGANATFYSFLAIKPNAGPDEINKAYRKLSRTLHPDKARGSWIANYNKPTPVKTKAGAKPTVHVQKDKKPSQSEIKKFNKEASARFERLSLVTNVLRGAERDRYDHFLKNGFPAWRGTGYYYERFRPGLGSVLFGLFIFIGGAVHYAALYLSHRRQKEFVERYIKHARRMAWGDDGGIGSIPGLGGAIPPPQQNGGAPDSDESMQWNRKQKREMERQKKKDGKNPLKVSAANRARLAQKAKDDGISTPVEAEVISGPVGAKKRTVAENGKILIVDSAGNVFLEEETEEGDTQEFLLDPDEVPTPTISDTVLVRLPIFLYNQSLGRVLGKTQDAAVADLIGEPEPEDEAEGAFALQQATAPNANGETRKRRTKNRS